MFTAVLPIDVYFRECDFLLGKRVTKREKGAEG